MKHLIVNVDKGSIAQELGIVPGCFLVSINSEEVLDIIDYEQLSANEKLTVCFEAPNGEIIEGQIHKDEYESLGLEFQCGLMSQIRNCKNRCVFCFIDQMPRGVRDTLHVKDDDWRLSLIMGNYITLTNVDDNEFERIIRRRVSPLYISVHATDGDVRRRMMGNPSAELILQRLKRLKQENLAFHCQIVLCPGINDGEVLKRTLAELYALKPAAKSVAVVPVGLTKYREGLHSLRCLTRDEAAAAIAEVEGYSCDTDAESETAFAYASDELYLTAGVELPSYEYYGDFDQLENGVGLLRKFEHEFIYALSGQTPLKKARCFASACGTAAAPFMQTLFNRLREYGITITVNPVVNDYFGHTITVSGLLCGIDLIKRISNVPESTVLIPRNMMREGEHVFLDGMHLNEVEKLSQKRIIPMCAFDAEEFVQQLFEIHT
ncbi:MAG: DUF512 domain-containing protein [Clostridia bacterium]